MLNYSIIIPAYNAENHLMNCINSILIRKNNDYEIIIVDDGSTDSTGKICDNLAKQYSNIKIIHTRNHGMASARNTGFSIAQGKYILHCDSDDKYDSEELNKILDIAPIYLQKYDLLCFDIRNVWNGEIENTPRYSADEIFFKNIDGRIDFITNDISHKMVGFAVWNKIYKKSVIDSFGIRSPERDILNHKDDWAEDLTFTIQYFLSCNSIKVLDNPVYLLSKHGTPETQSEKGLLDRIDHMYDLLEFACDVNSDDSSFQTKIQERFYEIFVWHIRRYLYLEIQFNSAEILRNKIVKSINSKKLINILKLAIKNKNVLKLKWNNQIYADYIALIEYILNGNILVFKIKNKLIWKKG